jgi:hypothetical protein
MEMFHDWHTRAAVRTQVRRAFSRDRDEGKLLFPPDLIPYMSHPLIAGVARSSSEELISKHLYQYLLFTTNFEISIVNRVTHRLAIASLPVGVPDSIRLDALKIYTDEGYHAVFSLDLIEQIRKITGIQPAPYTFDSYQDRLDAVARRALPNHIDLAQLIQVVIFETAITSILDDIPKDQNVALVVRETIADHARDERFHHAFFARVFKEVWAKLDDRAKNEIALALPELITTSLAPHTTPIQALLQSLGVNHDTARTVVEDTYTRNNVAAGIRKTARHTLHMLQSEGVLSRPGAEQMFHNALLLASLT